MVAVRAAPISIAAVMTIFITATKSLAEVVIVVGPVYVVTTIAEIGVPMR